MVFDCLLDAFWGGCWILRGACSWLLVVPSFINSNHASYWINLRSSSKRETDVLEIATFLPASDSLFGLRLMFKQSYFAWSDFVLNFTEMATEKPRIRKPRNLLCKQLTMSGLRSTIRPFFFAFMWTIEQFQDCRRPSFLIQQHKGKRQHTAIQQHKSRKLLCYVMKCFGKIHCKDTHSFYFRIIYRNLYSQMKVCLGGESP